MSMGLLQDRVIHRAVAQVALRAERQEAVGQLVETFVDPGVSVQLENDNNQILYGRRGTGKTHVLKVVERAAGDDEFMLYVDMRTLGSSSIFSDDERPMHVRVTSLLRDVLGHLENSLLEWATRPDVEVPGHVFEALDALGTAITRSVVVDPTVTTDERESKDLRSAAEAGLKVGGSPSVTLGAKEELAASRAAATTRTGRELNPVYFQEISAALEAVRETAGLRRITILLDEWTSVPLDLQPLLAEFLKRSFFTLPKVTVKIASLEYRSNFSEPLERNNVLGFELGADISSIIELDDYYVYDRNTDKTIAMFGELLYRHIAAEATSVFAASGEAERTLFPPEHYLAEAHGIANAEGFIRELFSSPDTFRELVRAGEGVVRDFISIFSAAFFTSVRRERPTIDIKAVQEAARDWYEKDKSKPVDEEQDRVLRTIIDEVIAQKRARSFLLEKQYEKEPVIQSLFDFRLLHLVQRGYADKDNPGLRYNIYTLDYGTYVDLIGTKSARPGTSPRT